MLYQPDKLLLIAGPCSLESRDLCREVADTLGKLKQEYPALNIIFKGSFDKANRTSASSKRGPGLQAGLKILQSVKTAFGLPVTTDIHLPEQAEAVAEVCDMLQIPAFLCRQTDLLLAAAGTGRAVNVKKGQFLAPADCVNIAEKLKSFDCDKFLITERGTTFGYNNLVADMRSLYWIREEGIPVIFDATHSVQRPGGMGATTGGDGELAPVLARAAIATGVDGIFMETHRKPAQALSDGPNQVPLEQIESVLLSLLKIHRALNA